MNYSDSELRDLRKNGWTRDGALSIDLRLNRNSKYYLKIGSSYSDDFKFKIEAHDTISMFRLYNRSTGEHFYTSNSEEQSGLVKAGWRDEGIGWVAPISSKTPVFRLYNPSAGDHHYTTNETEKNELVKAGWKDEGIGWYSDDNEGVPLYKEYNPHAKTGTHNYTTSESEHNGLVRAGWKDEGIGWYGVKE